MDGNTEVERPRMRCWCRMHHFICNRDFNREPIGMELLYFENSEHTRVAGHGHKSQTLMLGETEDWSDSLRISQYFTRYNI